jgi:hypothetical protein
MQRGTEYKIVFIFSFVMLSFGPLIRYSEMRHLPPPSASLQQLPADIQKEAEEISLKCALQIPSGGIYSVSHNEGYLGAYVHANNSILINADILHTRMFEPTLIHELSHANDSNYMAAGMIIHVPLAFAFAVITTKLTIIADKGKQCYKHCLIGCLAIILTMSFYFATYAATTYPPITILQEMHANYAVGVNTGHWYGFVRGIVDLLSHILIVAFLAAITHLLGKILKKDSALPQKANISN